MGSKKLLPSFQMITNGVMTGTSTITSTPASNIQNIDNVAIQIVWTGTPTGTLTVLGSVDGTHYEPLTFSPAFTQPSGSADDCMLVITQAPFLWLEIQYTNVSGVGTLNAFICGKDLN